MSIIHEVSVLKEQTMSIQMPSYVWEEARIRIVIYLKDSTRDLRIRPIYFLLSIPGWVSSYTGEELWAVSLATLARRAGDWLNCQWPMITSTMSVQWSLHKIPKDRVPVFKLIGGVGQAAHRERACKPCMLSPHLAPCISSWVFLWVFLSYILYNKPVF